MPTQCFAHATHMHLLLEEFQVLVAAQYDGKIRSSWWNVLHTWLLNTNACSGRWSSQDGPCATLLQAHNVLKSQGVIQSAPCIYCLSCPSWSFVVATKNCPQRLYMYCFIQSSMGSSSPHGSSAFPSSRSRPFT